AVVEPSPITATFTVSLGPTGRAPAPSNSRGIPSARPAVIESLRKFRRGIGFISLLISPWTWRTSAETDALGLGGGPADILASETRPVPGLPHRCGGERDLLTHGDSAARKRI